ncbi:hypothetical protein PENARI_c001G10454 [Penicillium arizonense]|uniref:A to I editase domain-containing protein n=1 Tax=Penicillium arizonense TaxID=1835702 RepID=A0A1F5LYI7_PENAI|nr:hypothetical protein PENARI_c001G10454 [Penicillium arizonense]OGE58106.1 hypothetical protein PENARI_c001G10454 [Penicillium arizonense]
MTGIVVVKGQDTASETLTCIAVTTGAKCLSASQIPRCKGLVLHDCHAEILAIRAFNYWLLTECHGLLSRERQLSKGHGHVSTENKETPNSPFIRKRTFEEHGDASRSPTEWPPFEFHSDIKIYMYCTCAPCGDASMELCMASQEDATPWEVLRQPKPALGSQELEVSDAENLLDGRAHFSLLGVVRRKPARTDAESTRSKSCSDKLALRQISSLLSCETSRLVAPTDNAYIAGLVLPEDEITQVGFDRCFGAEGRMQALVGRSWPATIETDNTPRYQFRPFQVLSVPSDEVAALWHFFKPKLIIPPTISSEQENGSSTSAASPKKCKPGNVSAVWTVAPSHQHPCSAIMDTGRKNLPHLARSKTGLYETIINGVKQGNRASSPGKRGASALSRAKLWALFRDISPTVSFHTDRTGASVTEPRLDTVQPGEVHGGTSQRTESGIAIYQGLKHPIDSKDPLHIRMQAIKDAKQVLKGWMPNSGDENWGLDVLVDQKKRKRDIPKALT